MASQETSNNSQYTVVARRYRPQAFTDLIGQGHVVKALSNAINSSRVGHAYLFTGARGVGKTSSARIFAKCLSCHDGPTTAPCNECDICESVSVGEDVDVLEIDGASNRGIDEIRQLRSNANVRPSRSRFKIYIIDEVHMLTQAAFNALLKTLEEPPEHVKFIFCTTDPQKIPITVLSRCQRFDFSPVKSDEIRNSLQKIAADEGVNAEDAALALLARRANGSMRDSQSLLEQLLSFCGETITTDDVNQLLGTADVQMIAEIAQQMAASDSSGTLAAIHTGLNGGVDAGQLAQQLLGYFRDLMAAKVGCDEELLLYTSVGQLDALREQGETLGLEKIMAIIQVLDGAVVRMQHSLHARTLIEVAAVRICSLQDLDSISDLVSALSSGEPIATRKPTARPAAVAATSPEPSPSPTKPKTSSASSENVSQKVSDETTEKKSDSKKNETAEITQTNTESNAVVANSSIPKFDPSNVESTWKQALELMPEMTRDMAAETEKLEFESPNTFKVTLVQRYSQQSCSRPERLKVIEDKLSEAAGCPLKIQFLWNESKKEHQLPPQPKLNRRQQIMELEKNEIIQQAIKVFDAEVVDFNSNRK